MAVHRMIKARQAKEDPASDSKNSDNTGTGVVSSTSAVAPQTSTVVTSSGGFNHFLSSFNDID